LVLGVQEVLLKLVVREVIPVVSDQSLPQAEVQEDRVGTMLRKPQQSDTDNLVAPVAEVQVSNLLEIPVEAELADKAIQEPHQHHLQRQKVVEVVVHFRLEVPTAPEETANLVRSQVVLSYAQVVVEVVVATHLLH
jgi:hypothetical protein